MNKLLENTYRRLGLLLILESFIFLGLFISGFYHKDIFYVLQCAIIAFFIINYSLLCFINKETKRGTTESEYRKYLLTKLESDYDAENKIREKEIIERREEKRTTPNKKDIIALMLKNNDEINDYFKISKGQAKSSFWFSIIACIIGIMMSGLSMYGFFTMKDTQFAIIGIIGGTITELIAGTVLVIHNKSALQLNYYYDALHENEKTLSAINLADKLPEDQRVQMYIEIIKTQIRESKMNNKS